MPDTSQFLEAYSRTRTIQNEIGSLAVQKIAKPTLIAEAKLLGLWRQGTFAVKSEEEMNVLFDHLVQDGHGGSSTPLERLTAKELAPLGPEAPLVHAALCKARLNIYRLEEPLPGLGWRIADLWTGQTRLVVDKVLSEQVRLKDALAVMRLVDMGEWSFSTGLQGTTLGQEHLDTLEALVLTNDLGSIPPGDFRPEGFTRALNLVWSRSLLRAWLRPGSVKLLSMPVEIAPEPASRRRRRR